MQDLGKIDLVIAGRLLREKITAEKEGRGRSFRHLSLAVKKKGGYIASYVAKDPEDWALPKVPTLGFLLRELGLSEEAFWQEVQERQPACIEHDNAA